MSGLSRRGTLGLAAFIVAAPVALVAAVPASPDAELIALCGEYISLQQQWNNAGAGVVLSGSPADLAADAERDLLGALQAPLLARLVELPCTTLEGFQALAAALAVWDLDLLNGSGHDAGTVMTANIVRRLLAMRGAA